MTLVVGSGAFTYAVQQDWFELPEGWCFGWVPAVACDSEDRVYVYSRSEHPMVVFDRDGCFVASWGEEVLKDAHGIFIDDRDQIWCVERETHCVRQFTRDGELLMTLGTPGQEGAAGQPFRLPTDLALDADGCIYVSDGYGNACIHKYSPAIDIPNLDECLVKRQNGLFVSISLFFNRSDSDASKGMRCVISGRRG